MSVYKKNVLIIVVGLLIAGCVTETDQSFINPVSNVQGDRQILEVLTLHDSLSVEQLFGEGTSIGALAADRNHIYLLDPFILTIFSISTDTFEPVFSIQPEEGRGPGEVTGISGFDTLNDEIILVNETLMKVQRWRDSGELLEEFIIEGVQPNRVSFWNDGNFTILSPSRPGDLLFHTFDREGDLLGSFGDVAGIEYNPVQFSGSVLVEGDDFYFAGHSEHILAKWNRDGELQYSVTSIDDFPSELNYLRFEGAEQRGWQLSEHGFYFALDLDIYQDYLIVVHGGSPMEEPYQQLVDIYNKQDGRYLASLEIPYRIGGLVVVDDFIVMLHRIDGEVYLGIYENRLQEILSEVIE